MAFDFPLSQKRTWRSVLYVVLLHGISILSYKNYKWLMFFFQMCIWYEPDMNSLVFPVTYSGYFCCKWFLVGHQHRSCIQTAKFMINIPHLPRPALSIKALIAVF